MSGSGECKLEYTVDRYDLTPPGDRSDSIDEYLVARWTGSEGGDAVGYKQLTRWFNERLLRQVYDRHGRETLGTRLESEYEALTGEDDLLRKEVAADLERHGIDADKLRRDMISWSTMRRHLKGCLDAEKEQTETATDWEIRSVEIAREQLGEKTAAALRSLENKDTLPGATAAEIEIQVKVSCPECPTRVPLTDALGRGYICDTHLSASQTVESDDSADGSSPLFGVGVAGIGLAESTVPPGDAVSGLYSVSTIAVDLLGGLPL